MVMVRGMVIHQKPMIGKERSNKEQVTQSRKEKNVTRKKLRLE